MKQKNVLFCILRDARSKVSDVVNQVNEPLHEYQKVFKGARKAFVYQYDGKVMISDFRQSDLKDIFYMYSRTEQSDYWMCLKVAFSMLEKCPEEEDNSLIILMEQNISDDDFEQFRALYKNNEINGKVLLVYNGNQEAGNIGGTMKRFVDELKDHTNNSCGKIRTFKELIESGDYSL